MTKRTTIFAAVFAAALSVTFSVQAENYDYYWKGGSGNYFTQSNWQLSDGTAAPVALDSSGNAITAYVQASGSAVTFNYSILGAAVRSLTIGGGSGSASVTRNSNSSLTIDSGKFISVLSNGTLTVQNTTSINAGGTLTVDGGTYNQTGMTISGTFDYTSSKNFVNSNTITLNDGGSLNIAGDGQFRINGASATLNIQGGNATVDSISYIGVTANGVINQTGGNATFSKALALGWGNGDGTYNLSAGTLTTTSFAGLWCDKGSGYNTFNVTGGTANFKKTGNSFAIGLYEDGTANQWNPKQVANEFNLYSGTVNADDTFAIQYGGTLNVAKNGETGGDGVLNAKAITITNGGKLNISSGTVNVGEGGTTLSDGTITISGSGLLKSSTIDVASGTTLTYYNTVPNNDSALTFNVNGGTLELYNDRTTTETHKDNNAIATNAAVTINGIGGTLLIDGGGCIGVINKDGTSVNFALDANSVLYVKSGYFINGGWTSQNWDNNNAELRIGATGKVDLWDGAQMKVGGLSGEAGAQLFVNDTYSRNGIVIGAGVTDDKSYTYNGTISLKGKSLESIGEGTQTLNGDITNTNIYSKAGTLILGKAGNDMKINSGVIIKEDGGQVQVDGNLIVESGMFSPRGTWDTGNGTITLKSGTETRVGGSIGSTIGIKLDGGLLFNDGDNGGTTVTISSPITVLSASELKCGWSGSLTLSGGLNGSGNLTVVNDSGWVQVTGKGNYSGKWTIYGNFRMGASKVGSKEDPAKASDYIGNGEITFSQTHYDDNNEILERIFQNNDNFLTFANDLNFVGDGYLKAGWSKDMTFTGNIKGSGRVEIHADSGWVNMGTKCTDGAFTGDVQMNWSGSAEKEKGKMRLTANQPFGANAGTAKIYGDLDMNGFSQTFKGLYNDGDKGKVFNNSTALSTLTLDTTGQDWTFQSSITGKIALVVKGTGTQTLSKAPEYTGSTTVQSGTLGLSQGGTLYNLSGDEGTVSFGANTLTLSNSASSTFSGSLSGSGTVLIANNDKNAVITMATTCENNSFTGDVQVNFSSATNHGSLKLGSAQPFGDNAGTANMYGTMDMNGFSQKFKGLKSDNGSGYQKGNIYNDTETLSTLTLDTTSQDNTYYGVITGNVALVLTGTGQQTFIQAPASVSTMVESGTLVLSNGGTLNNLSGDEGTLSYGANGLTLSNSADTVFSGKLTGTGKVTVVSNTQSAWIEFGATNDDFTGVIQINHGSKTNEGKVRLGADNALGTANRAFIYGTIDMNGYDQSFSGLSNDGDKGSIYNNADTLSTLTIDNISQSLDFKSSIAGNIALVLTGTESGKLTLTKAPEYIGSTTIEMGTLALAQGGTLYNLSGGSANASGDQMVDKATLDASGKALTIDNNETTKFVGWIKADSITKTGEGTLQIFTDATGQVDQAHLLVSSGRLDMKEYFKGSIEVGEGAELSPGNSIGKLTIDGTLTLDSGSKLIMEIAGSDVLQNDQLIVTGGIDINEGVVIELVPAAGSSLSPNDPFAIKLTSENGLEPEEEEAILNALTSYYFTGFDFEYNEEGQYYEITGLVDPNAVPEPSTWALLILGAAGLMYWRKRK